MFRSFYLFIAFLFFAIIVRSQEKRIALVIGNAEYTHASSLKNPINDAELMKTTLASLGFEVIEAKNLKTQRQFLDSIRSFQRKSASYNVRFVYYAGHAVQIGEENYLLPTEEKYQNATDFKDYAIPLGLITKEFTAEENLSSVINVVILDACRDNPNKNVESRGVVIESLFKERSSNEVLIAYATTSGAAAADGLKDGKNSVFCSSLAKHMMLPDVPFEEVLKKVRIDVKKALNQQPEYLNRLDHTLYLKKSSYTDQIIIIDSLIYKEDYDMARAKVEILLEKAPNYKLALLRKARIEYNDNNKNYDGAHLFRADSLYPNDSEVLEYLGLYYSTIGEVEKANKTIDRAMSLFPKDPNLVYWKARFNWESENLADAEKFFTKAIILDSTEQRFLDRASFYESYPDFYDKAQKDYDIILELSTNKSQSHYIRGNFFKDILKDHKKALKEYNQAIILNPDNALYLYARGVLYADNLNNSENAIEDWKSILKIDTSDIDALNAIGSEYIKLGDTLTGLKWFENGIRLESINPNSSAFCYSNRAEVFSKQGKFVDAFNDYTKAINNSIYKSDYFFKRYEFFLNFKEDEISAMNDLNEAIRLDPYNVYYLYDRGVLWVDYLKNDSKAIEDWNKALDIDPGYTNAINAIGTIYMANGDTLKAIEQFNKGILLENQSPDAAAFCYGNRADIYAQLGKLSDAENDYSTAINLSTSKPIRYYSRALFYYNNKKDFNACIKDLDMAIKLDPLNINYLHDRGVILRELKKYDKAILDFEQILQIDPENIDAINSIGNILEEEEKYDLVKAQYNKGIALEKNNPQKAAYCYVNRAGIYEKERKLELALADYSKAIELDSKNAFWYYSKGAFLENFMNKPYDALLDYTLAISLDSMEISYWWQRGQLFSEKLNNQEMAIKDFDQILKIKPNDVNSLNWRTIFYHRNNEISKAIEGYKKIISMGDSIKKMENIEGDYGWANINLAIIYQCDNKIEEASKLYDEWVSYMTDYAEGYYWRAWFYSLYKSQYEFAISDFTTSIKLEPKNPHWFLNRSKIYLLKGELKNAKNDINEALKISNESAVYIAERGNYYSITGEYDKATKDFKESLKLDSANRRTFHYITEDLIRQGKLNDALKNATLTTKLFKNDTISYEQLGRIYLSNNEVHKALISYTNAASIMEFNEGYRTIYPHDIQVFLSDIYVKIAELYKMLNQSELECEALSKAIEFVVFETRPDRQKMIKEIQEKLNNCKN
jgi:tetratricopeptide (TPR) repeat protein